MSGLEAWRESANKRAYLTVIVLCLFLLITLSIFFYAPLINYKETREEVVSFYDGVRFKLTLPNGTIGYWYPEENGCAIPSNYNEVWSDFWHYPDSIRSFCLQFGATAEIEEYGGTTWKNVTYMISRSVSSLLFGVGYYEEVES